MENTDPKEQEKQRVAGLLQKQKFPVKSLNPAYPYAVMGFPVEALLRELKMKLVEPPES